jgi:LCP family protein required for cell wall assembly
LAASRPTPRRRRLAFAAALVAMWVAGTALGAIPEPHRAGARPLLQIEPVRAGYVPALDGSEPVFVLLIGSDARPGEDIAGMRADSIHIVAINPAKRRATIVGIPRDSYVAIPGFGTNKINAAMVNGGPPLVVQTVEQLTGIEMDYWALTWFEGFTAMIDDVGGLQMDVPFDLVDRYAHAQLEAGPQVLNGRNALAFARTRHALPTGDFGRSENQGRLMMAALIQFQREFRRDPSRLLTWIGAGLRNAETSVSLDELLALAFTGTTLNDRKVVNVVLPGGSGMAGGIAVVHLDQAMLAAISEDLADDGLLRPENVPPSPNASLLPDAETQAE